MMEVDENASNPAAAAGRPGSGAGLADEVAALRALLAEANPPDLTARLAAARSRWPGDLAVLLLQGGWFEKSGCPERAEECFRSAEAAFPASPWPPVRLADLLLRMNRGAEAAEIVSGQVWTGRAPESTRIALMTRMMVAFTDMEARRIFLSGLLRGTPDDRFVLLKLAALSFRNRERQQAGQYFAAARELGPLPLESQLLELELHLAENRSEEAYALASQLHDRHPERADLARRAIQAAHFSGRVEAMTALLGKALRQWPRDWLLMFRYNRCTIPLQADRALFTLALEHATAMAGDQRWLFQFSIACLRHGEIDRALPIIERLSHQNPVAEMAAPLHAALSAHPRAVWGNARNVSNDPHMDVQVVRVPGAIATIILLGGVQGGLGYLPFGCADGLFSQRKVNVVYLRDLNNRAFTSGVRRFGAGQERMVHALRAHVAELGANVVTMGSSVGGLAAIRLAALMQAHAAISFAGPIHLGIDAQDEAAVGPSGGTRGTMFSAYTKADLGIVEMIRSAPHTRIHQCYGGGFAPDVEAAGLLEGLPNVVPHPVPTCADHFAIEHMIANSAFFDVLDMAIEMPPPP